MKKHPMTSPVLLSLLLLLLATPVLAQESGQEPAQFEGLVEVSEVLLDVIATDRKGRVIRGLGMEDFVVEENGEPVPITSVSFYSTRYEGLEEAVDGAPTGEAVPEIPSSRYFILYFEDQRRNSNSLNRLMRQQMEAGRRAHDWIRDSLGPSDWVAVVSYDVKLIVHQDFTQDVGSLLKAVVEASQGKRPPEMKRSEYDRAISGTAPALWRGLPDPTDLRDETKRPYDAFRLLAEASRPIVGRKNLLYFGIGFGDLEPGGFSRGDQRFYPAMEQALNDNNVAVYPIDLTPSPVDHVQSHFLNQMALDSGGFYHFNIVNFITPLTRISMENVGYYAISYRTEHPAGESGYRQVTVKATNKKVKVRTRKGYKYGI